MVLFFGLIFSVPPWKFFCRRPCLTLRLTYSLQVQLKTFHSPDETLKVEILIANYALLSKYLVSLIIQPLCENAQSL